MLRLLHRATRNGRAPSSPRALRLNGIVLEVLSRMNSMVIVARLRLEDYRASLERLLGDHDDAAARRALAEVLAAIARINRGAYGTCERCGGAIGHQRLLAVPTTHFCTGCASATRSVEL